MMPKIEISTDNPLFEPYWTEHIQQHWARCSICGLDNRVSGIGELPRGWLNLRFSTRVEYPPEIGDFEVRGKMFCSPVCFLRWAETDEPQGWEQGIHEWAQKPSKGSTTE